MRSRKGMAAAQPAASVPDVDGVEPRRGPACELNSERECGAWRAWFWFVLPLLLPLLALRSLPLAAEGPIPPCGDPPRPAYAELGAPPRVEVWRGRDGADAWSPPPCTGWSATGFSALIAVAGRFRAEGGLREMLTRFDAVSRLVTVRYWSVTHKRWSDLIDEAHALREPNRREPRSDFSAKEVMQGRDLYFLQDDNLGGPTVHRMRAREVSPDRLVVEVENHTAIRFALLTLFPPGELRSLYFLDRESDDV